jgi:probable O-glycosylation ligase (exosortase A-associated)
MRDLLVAAVFIPAVVMALRRPWIGVLVWTWISLMNPHRFSWGWMYSAPLAAIAAGVCVLGLMMTRERQSPFQGAPVNWLVAFTLWVTLSWLLGYGMASNDPDVWHQDYALWNRVMKIVFMTLVGMMLLRNRYQILAFIWVAVMSLAILGAKGGVFTVLSGGSYHVYGPPGSQAYDNNDFALALVMLIPLLHFLQLQVTQRWGRHLMSVIMLLCAASALGSQSRGGMLAMAAMGAVMWWRSRRKGVIGLAIIATVALLLPMMPEEWWARMTSINAYEEDASAMGRIRAWKVAIQVAWHHITGAGMVFNHPIIFAMWDDTGGRILAAHSIYFQMLGNHGFIGLFLFLMVGASTYYYAGWLRRNAKNIKNAQWAADLGSMVQVSMAGFAVGGAFLSMGYYDFPYDMLVMVVLARRWVESRGWERDPQMGFLEYCGLWRQRRHKRAHTRHGRRDTAGAVD